jgi:hypothetical protein
MVFTQWPGIVTKGDGVLYGAEDSHELSFLDLVLTVACVCSSYCRIGVFWLGVWHRCTIEVQTPHMAQLGWIFLCTYTDAVRLITNCAKNHELYSLLELDR